MTEPLRLFHRTDHAGRILAEGFRDGEETRPDGRRLTGVWFAERPLDGEECEGDQILALDVPAAAAAPYLVDDEKEPYREYCIPARIANGLARPRLAARDGSRI